MALVCLAANLVFVLTLMWPLAHVGIALATALSAWMNAGLLAWLLHRDRLLQPDARLRQRLPRIVGASLAMAAGLWFGRAWLAPLPPILGLALLVAAGGGGFLLLAKLSGALVIGELREALGRAQRLTFGPSCRDNSAPIPIRDRYRRQAMKGRIFSGVQPSGNLHLGNYLGAIRNWVRLQGEYECDLLHRRPARDHRAAGTERSCAPRPSRSPRAFWPPASIPGSTTIFVQSHVPAHTQLAWVFNCVAPLGWLNRMTQFKDKAGKNREQALASGSTSIRC